VDTCEEIIMVVRK